MKREFSFLRHLNIKSVLFLDIKYLITSMCKCNRADIVTLFYYFHQIILEFFLIFYFEEIFFNNKYLTSKYKSEFQNRFE